MRYHPLRDGLSSCSFLITTYFTAKQEEAVVVEDEPGLPCLSGICFFFSDPGIVAMALMSPFVFGFCSLHSLDRVSPRRWLCPSAIRELACVSEWSGRERRKRRTDSKAANHWDWGGKEFACYYYFYVLVCTLLDARIMSNDDVFRTVVRQIGLEGRWHGRDWRCLCGWTRIC